MVAQRFRAAFIAWDSPCGKGQRNSAWNYGFMIKWGTSPQRAENPITWNHLEIDTKWLFPLAKKS
jgi:hypothetical protein